jgi:hypothetical protein
LAGFEPEELGPLQALFGLGDTLDRTSLHSVPSRQVQILPRAPKQQRT